MKQEAFEANHGNTCANKKTINKPEPALVGRTPAN